MKRARSRVLAPESKRSKDGLEIELIGFREERGPSLLAAEFFCFERAALDLEIERERRA